MMKKKEHLPLFGVGPFLVAGMAVVAAAAIAVFCYGFKLGTLSGFPAALLTAIGVALIIAGLLVWFIGAMRSEMDDHIKENRLKTDGIYAWVRNPMYSGWWIALTGITFMWHNVCMLSLPLIDWAIMTIALINTEEKWLLTLYADEYVEYKKHVNRCIPWKRK